MEQKNVNRVHFHGLIDHIMSGRLKKLKSNLNSMVDQSRQVVQLGRRDPGGDVEVSEGLSPPAVILDHVHGDGVRPEVVPEPVEVVHPRLEVVAVLAPLPDVEPLAEEEVLGAVGVVVPEDVLVGGHPARDVPRHDVPHAVQEQHRVVADGEASRS